MSRKKAVNKAIEVLTQIKNEGKLEEYNIKKSQIDGLIRDLNFLFNTLPRIYSKDDILAQLENFRLINGRLPGKEEFENPVKNNLPSRKIIKNVFGYNYYDLLLKEYKDEYYISRDKIYTSKTKDEWYEFFKEEFERLNYPMLSSYNRLRKKDTPTGKLLAKICGFNNYTEMASSVVSDMSVVNEPDDISVKRYSKKPKFNITENNIEKGDISEQLDLLENELNCITAKISIDTKGKIS